MAQPPLPAPQQQLVEAGRHPDRVWYTWLRYIDQQVRTLIPGVDAAVPSTRQVIAGDGLTGGGPLAADVTLNVGAGANITVTADAVAVTDGAFDEAGTAAAAILAHEAAADPHPDYLAVTDSSTVGQVLRVTGASTYAWGALDLADTDAVTGILPAAQLPTATETASGIVELATLGEANTGTDATRAITAAGLTSRLASPGTIGGTTPAQVVCAPLTLPGEAVTIATGAITVTRSLAVVDTEGGIPTDDLDNINGGASGDILMLRSTSSARDIVVKHLSGGTGNIRCQGSADQTITTNTSTIMFIKSGSVWFQIAPICIV